MNLLKNKTPIIRGTLYLTVTGFLSRIIGFFYRIFLSQTIGAEGMGIYQMIFPIFSLCFSLTAAGIQTSVSKFVAGAIVNGEKQSAKDILKAGLFLSLSLSAITTLCLYINADSIAANILHEVRCAPLLRILAFAIPLEAIHCCINGYYYGIKKAAIPSITQLIEQTVRVGSVFAIYHIIIFNGKVPALSITVLGIICGEAASILFSVTCILLHFYKDKLKDIMSMHISSLTRHIRIQKLTMLHHTANLIKMAAPLTANRVVINLLASAEAIYLPSRLRLYGLTPSQALSVYGILTGMALPLILFPSAITNSVSVMLLPAISEDEARGDIYAISHAVKKTIQYCFLLGSICTIGFLITGSFLGNFLFHSELAGNFILILSFICPFLYLSSTLSSILHGLGKTARTFVFSLIGLGIRLLFILFAVPIFGITGYLWGLLFSQLALAALNLLALRRYIYYNKRV